MTESFAPWMEQECVQECCVDGVCCCFETIGHGHARIVPVSEKHPLHTTRHFVAAKQMDADISCIGDDIQSYYQRLGVVVLGTVTDGDFGVDCACLMLGLASTREARDQVREDFHFFLFLFSPTTLRTPRQGPSPKTIPQGPPPSKNFLETQPVRTYQITLWPEWKRHGCRS